MADRRSGESLKAGRRAAGRAESSETGVGDPTLRRLQQGLGNDGLRGQIDQGRADRSTMLTHLCDRLAVMRELQSREMDLMVKGSNYAFWRDVARDRSGRMTEPQPDRWHAAAEAYKQAGAALCSGDLGRGMQLMERAMTAEDKTIERLSSVVDITDLGADTRPDSSMLDGMVGMGQVESIPRPEGMAIADEILGTQHEPLDLAHLRPTARPWWAEEEEEEDGEGGDAPADGEGG